MGDQFQNRLLITLFENFSTINVHKKSVIRKIGIKRKQAVRWITLPKFYGKSNDGDKAL